MCLLLKVSNRVIEKRIDPNLIPLVIEYEEGIIGHSEVPVSQLSWFKDLCSALYPHHCQCQPLLQRTRLALIHRPLKEYRASSHFITDKLLLSELHPKFSHERVCCWVACAR